MVDALMLEVLHELIRCKGWAIVCIDVAGGPYRDMSSCSIWERDRADLEFTLNRKEYLLNRSQMSRYSLPF